jgi:hypothetical protein
MECYTNFIVPRTTCNGLNTVKPTSLLYVDDLPGFSTIALANIEPGKYGTAATMIEEKLRVACEKVMEEVGHSVSLYVREKAPMEAGRIGEEISDPTNTDSTVEAPLGTRIKLDNGSGILLKLGIPRIWFLCKGDQEGVTITVKDGLLTTTYTMDAVDGLNEFGLEYVSRTNVVDITVTHPDGLSMYPFTMVNSKYYASCASCTHGVKYKYMLGLGLNNGQEDDEEGYVSVEVQAVCVFGAAQCLLLREYRWAILYQFGIECLEEWTITGRMNFLGIHGKPWAEQKKVEWAAIVEKHLEKKANKTANFLARLTPQCVKCGTGVTYGYAL